MFSPHALRSRESCRFRNDSKRMRPALRAKIAPALADRGENLPAGISAPHAGPASCLPLRTQRPCRRYQVCGGRDNAQWFRSAFHKQTVADGSVEHSTCEKRGSELVSKIAAEKW